MRENIVVQQVRICWPRPMPLAGTSTRVGMESGLWVTWQEGCVDSTNFPPQGPAARYKSAAECIKPKLIALMQIKLLFLGDSLKEERLDVRLLTETWQREQEYTHLNEQFPPDCWTLPVARRGGSTFL
ncbi:hypothetical protein AMECASPLE_014140 [Ameca splendens]|uniref:Uncharacterized protein n=1 Tax=Ameca splendens TaxID=208324 RepID=A0ABV0ZNE3_9TELE